MDQVVNQVVEVVVVSSLGSGISVADKQLVRYTSIKTILLSANETGKPLVILATTNLFYKQRLIILTQNVDCFGR